MKKVLIFIGLKVAEAIALLAILYGFYFIGNQIFATDPWYIDILTGFLVLFAVFASTITIVTIIYASDHLIKFNWEWAKKIEARLTKWNRHEPR